MPENFSVQSDIKEMLQRFRRSLEMVAAGAHYRQVVDGYGEFGELQERSCEECQAASLYPDSSTVEAVHFSIKSTAADTSVSDQAAQTISTIQLEFKTGKVFLRDLEAEFGSWYRDPPEPRQVSYAGAYFNPKLISKDAQFFVYGVCNEYGDSLCQDSEVNLVNVEPTDNRYVTDRPW